ncbi:MAG: NUDIX domain-containing protein [Chloroflexota bacterium]
MPISRHLQTIRKKVGSDLLIMPGVSVACFDERRRLLLADHGGTKGWAIPGGSVDPDDLPAGTAIREMWEETQLQVEPIRVVGVYGGEDFLVTYPNGDQVDYKDTLMECRIVGGQMEADGDEIMGLGFFARAEIEQMPLPDWMNQILPHIYGDESRTFFSPVTWSPPENGLRKGGISEYIRALREQIGQQQLMMPAAAGIVWDTNGRILMQRRSDNGLWGLPGGAIDPFETPVDAVVREVWEETGVLVEPTRVAGVFSGRESHVTYPHGDQVAIYSFVFECQIVSGTPTIDQHETLEVGFYTPAELAKLIMAPRWQRRIPLMLQNQSPSAYFDPVDIHRTTSLRQKY